MITLTPWIEHLSQSITSLRDVGGAADLSSIQNDRVVLPGAWVIPLSETSGDNELITGVSQRVEVTIGIVIAVRNLRDSRGQAAQDDLTLIRQPIHDAVLGWSPDNNYDPAIFISGKLLSMTDQVLWWQDEFKTAYYIRY